MRNDSACQVQATVCAKVLKQTRQLWLLSASPHSSPMKPTLQLPLSCALPSSCLVVPPVPGPPGSDSRDTSSGKSSVAHQATSPLAALCRHNTIYTSSLWCLPFLKILVHLAFPLNSTLLEGKDQSLFCFCFFSCLAPPSSGRG